MDVGLRTNNYHKKVSYHAVNVEVIIPTLNEEQAIGELIDSISKLDLGLKTSILVIDGGSTDNTLEICKKKKNVKVSVQKQRGKGNAMREAVDQSDADIVVFIDGDGTYSPSDMGSLIEPLLQGKSDMVVGSRVLGKREKGSIVRVNSIGNKVFNRTINFAMKSSITDSLSGYRALFRKTFKELVLFSASFEIEVEMTVEALARGLRILEVPISYGVRKGSVTKLHPLNDGARIARTLVFILMNVNPLKFFSLIALALVVAGLYPAAYVLNEKISTGEITSMPSVVFSSLLFVTATISMVVGLLAELVSSSRRRLEYLLNKKNNS